MLHFFGSKVQGFKRSEFEVRTFAESKPASLNLENPRTIELLNNSLSHKRAGRRYWGVHAPSDVVDAVGTRPAAFDFDAVFQSDYDRIARAIARVIRDPARAEELAVETFWRLWRHPRAHGDGASGWLYRTAIRLALDELRRRARRSRYEQMLAAFRRTPRTPNDLFSAAEEQGRVRGVLAALAPRQAELLLLRSDGLSYEELAATLSITPASIGTLLSRARAAFQKEYVKRHGQQ
jgi:RNA polymerase sigma-70 factor (ECF subfamily)